MRKRTLRNSQFCKLKRSILYSVSFVRYTWIWRSASARKYRSSTRRHCPPFLASSATRTRSKRCAKSATSKWTRRLCSSKYFHLLFLNVYCTVRWRTHLFALFLWCSTIATGDRSLMPSWTYSLSVACFLFTRNRLQIPNLYCSPILDQLSGLLLVHHLLFNLKYIV